MLSFHSMTIICHYLSWFWVNESVTSLNQKLTVVIDYWNGLLELRGAEFPWMLKLHGDDLFCCWISCCWTWLLKMVCWILKLLAFHAAEIVSNIEIQGSYIMGVFVFTVNVKTFTSNLPFLKKKKKNLSTFCYIFICFLFFSL